MSEDLIVRVPLSEEELDLIKKQQKIREQKRLPCLGIEQLIKMYMLEGMFQRHFLEQKEARQ